MIEAAQRPANFPARDDLHEGLRAVRHGRYLIFFLASPEEVRILHGARDLPRIFTHDGRRSGSTAAPAFLSKEWRPTPCAPP